MPRLRCREPIPQTSRRKFPDVTGAPAPMGKQASRCTPTRRSLGTTSSRAVSPSCPSVVHRHSMGARRPQPRRIPTQASKAHECARGRAALRAAFSAMPRRCVDQFAVGLEPSGRFFEGVRDRVLEPQRAAVAGRRRSMRRSRTVCGRAGPGACRATAEVDVEAALAWHDYRVDRTTSAALRLRAGPAASETSVSCPETDGACASGGGGAIPRPPRTQSVHRPPPRLLTPRRLAGGARRWRPPGPR